MKWIQTHTHRHTDTHSCTHSDIRDTHTHRHSHTFRQLVAQDVRWCVHCGSTCRTLSQHKGGGGRGVTVRVSFCLTWIRTPPPPLSFSRGVFERLAKRFVEWFTSVGFYSSSTLKVSLCCFSKWLKHICCGCCCVYQVHRVCIHCF